MQFCHAQKEMSVPHVVIQMSVSSFFWGIMLILQVLSRLFLRVNIEPLRIPARVTFSWSIGVEMYLEVQLDN